MPTKTVLADKSLEGQTREIGLTITDLAGTGFKPDIVTVTLYCVEDGSIINARDAQSVRDVNNGTVSAGGVLVLTLQPLDNVIVLPRTGKSEETHHAFFEWERTSPLLKGAHTVEFTIEDHSKV